MTAPMELAKHIPLVNIDDFKSIGERSNGKSVFSNQRDATLKFDENQGFWRYVRTQDLDKKITNPITNDDAEKMTEKLFQEFELQSDQKAKTHAVGIAIAATRQEGEQQYTLIGRHVRIYRQIEGWRVEGSRIMADYELDGALKKFQISWPEIVVKESCSLSSTEKVIEKLAEDKEGHFVNYDGSERILSKPLYVELDETGEYIPALRVSFGSSERERVGNQFIASLCESDN